MMTRSPSLILAAATIACALQVSAAPGDLDSTFDGDGKLTTIVSTNAFGMDQARAVLVQGDGKIVAVGESDSHIGLVRYLPNGTLNPGFGDGGRVITLLTENDYFYVTDAALQPDGKIVVAGGAFVNSAFVFVLARIVGDAAAPANPLLSIVPSGAGLATISWTPA